MNEKAKSTWGSTPRMVRDATAARRRRGPDEGGFIRYAYRPFDNRWLYWEADTKLLDEEARHALTTEPHVFGGTLWRTCLRHLAIFGGTQTEPRQAAAVTHVFIWMCSLALDRVFLAGRHLIEHVPRMAA